MTTKKLQACMNDYRQGYSLPQAFYTDEDVFCAEWGLIFKRDWLFAGSVAQIPKPGDYFLYGLRNDSIIIIRGNSREVYAHHNTCRHRGSVICTKEQGHVAKLICPYHQWVYDKDGTLTNARMMPADFAKRTILCTGCTCR